MNRDRALRHIAHKINAIYNCYNTSAHYIRRVDDVYNVYDKKSGLRLYSDANESKAIGVLQFLDRLANISTHKEYEIVVLMRLNNICTREKFIKYIQPKFNLDDTEIDRLLRLAFPDKLLPEEEQFIKTSIDVDRFYSEFSSEWGELVKDYNFRLSSSDDRLFFNFDKLVHKYGLDQQ